LRERAQEEGEKDEIEAGREGAGEFSREGRR